MVDLNMAYGSFNEGFDNDEGGASSYQQEKPPQRKQLRMGGGGADDDYSQHQEQAMVMPKQRVQLPPPPPPPPQVVNEIAKFTNYQQSQQSQSQRFPEYSFWDRMVMSRREVIKLFILSIVIVLGISLEKLACHYIGIYLSSNDLSTFQEFLIRLSFPIVVFIILWIIKSL